MGVVVVGHQELKRLVLQVDWLRLRNLAACVGQTVEKKDCGAICPDEPEKEDED